MIERVARGNAKQTAARGRDAIDRAPPSQSSWTIPSGVLIIVVFTIVAYLPAIRGGFIWDDPDYVLHNQNLRSLAGLMNIWFVPTSSPQYYPLVFTTFWIEYHLWGLEPLGYHLVNVLLHTASALLLWRILARLRVPGAWLAAAIFALHPVMVESVAWVTERKNVLSLLLYLSAGYVYLFRVAKLRSETDANPEPEEKTQRADPRLPLRGNSPWTWYALSLALLLSALFSKTVTASLPAAILLILYWKRGRITWRDVALLVPFFIVGAALGAFTSHLEKTHVGASGEKIIELHLSFIQRCLIAGRAIWFYAGKLVWPTKLAFIYPRWNEIDTPTPAQWIYPAAVILVVPVLFVLRNRIGRGPLVAVLLFCGTLFPALGFVNVYPMRFSFVADHFQYHASIALIVLIAIGLTCAARKLAGRRALAVICALVLSSLGMLTWKQAHLYTDALTLWRETAEKNPGSWMVWTNLGNTLVQRKQLDEAIPYYLRAVELAPWERETHWNAGTAYMRLGDVDRAEREYREAVRLDPDFPPGWASLGQLLYYRRHDVPGAMEAYRKALAIAPYYAEGNAMLARALEAQGDIDGAIEHYSRAALADPDDRDSHYNLGNLLLSQRQFAKAVYNLREAVRVDPNYAEAWANLGAAQMQMGHREEAIRSLREALRINPMLVPPRRNLQLLGAG